MRNVGIKRFPADFRQQSTVAKSIHEEPQAANGQIKSKKKSISPENAELAAKHLGLAIAIARKIFHNESIPEDVIAEGYLGLCEAAARFSPDKGACFMTYATYWVRARLLDYYIRTTGPVRFGGNSRDRMVFFKFKKAQTAVAAKYGDAASQNPELLAAELKIKPHEIERMLPRLDRRDVCLDATVDRGKGDSRPGAAAFHTLFASDDATPEEDFAEREGDVEQRKLLRRALQHLGVRERKIIRERHMAKNPKTLMALGLEFGLSRERVRQLEKRALQFLQRMVQSPYRMAL